jgi:hypothetical protein
LIHAITLCTMYSLKYICASNFSSVNLHLTVIKEICDVGITVKVLWSLMYVFISRCFEIKETIYPKHWFYRSIKSLNIRVRMRGIISRGLSASDAHPNDKQWFYQTIKSPIWIYNFDSNTTLTNKCCRTWYLPKLRLICFRTYFHRVTFLVGTLRV